MFALTASNLYTFGFQRRALQFCVTVWSPVSNFETGSGSYWFERPHQLAKGEAGRTAVYVKATNSFLILLQEGFASSFFYYWLQLPFKPKLILKKYILKSIFCWKKMFYTFTLIGNWEENKDVQQGPSLLPHPLLLTPMLQVNTEWTAKPQLWQPE